MSTGNDPPKLPEEGVVSFDDDDDEMAELFSFGASSSPGQAPEPIDYSGALDSVMPLPATPQDGDVSTHSDDSFIELLEQQKETTVLDAASLSNKNKLKPKKSEAKDDEYGDKQMQEVLDWLDQDDDHQNEEEEMVFVEPPKPPSLATTLARHRPPSPPPSFGTLEEAVKSPKSTVAQIRNLLEKEKYIVSTSVRPHLWCRVVCGKTLEDTMISSVADSFQEWEKHWQQESSENPNALPAKQLEWIKKESTVLADRIAFVLRGDVDLTQKALSTILVNHYASRAIPSHENDDDASLSHEDPLLPPVACAILSAGVPKVAAAVMLSKIVPTFMPILGLSTSEREKAALALHQQFHLLACYHFPLLVMHLDRCFPDWYHWPTKGFLPQSYLISHLAGECGGAFMNPRWLQSLWDLILTSSNSSLRFFLTVAILENHADQLLILTGDTLKSELERIFAFKHNTSGDGFAIEDEEDTTKDQADTWVHDWTDRAQALWEATPVSVVLALRKLEDDAVDEALVRRQKEAEVRLKLRLEAEAKAHKEAIEAESERKADEARLRLTRARLVAYYRQYNPGKESNIDKIMKTYDGRFEVLDAKLKQKYGVGFNPALKPRMAVNKTTSKPFGGFGGRRQIFGAKRKEDAENDELHQEACNAAVVKVAPGEILPVLCWSKEANQEKVAKIKKGSKASASDEKRIPLKYYLVDSRPEDSARDQGRFPISISLSPESLLDLDRLEKQEDMFESLRGSVHLCIMGEGYAALSRLYGHKMTRGLSECIKEDDARNNNCAMFFLKKGFPFVSILDGGFAAAHAYLCREGPKAHLRVQNVLTDYNPEVSLFGQFEKVHNSTGREKAQRKLQNLFDSSMTAITKNTLRFDRTMASDLGGGIASGEKTQKSGPNMVTRFFSSEEQGSKNEAPPPTSNQQRKDHEPENGPKFRNPFARKNQSAVEASEPLERQVSDKPMEVSTIEADSAPFERSGTTDHKSTFTRLVQGVNPAPAKGPEAPISSDESNDVKLADPQAKPNAFTGFGAALNNSLKTNKANEAAKQRPRNPFARFGMNNISGSQQKRTESQGAGMSHHLAGFNQFRKNTMARMRTGATQGEEADSGDNEASATSTEEIVSMDQSPVVVASAGANGTQGMVEDEPNQSSGHQAFRSDLDPDQLHEGQKSDANVAKKETLATPQVAKV